MVPLRLFEICAQNQENAISKDLNYQTFLIKALCPSEYFNPNLPFSDFPIYILRYCCLGPSCTGLSEEGLYIWVISYILHIEGLYLTERALRLMFFAGKRSHAIPLFVSANVLPLNMLYFETVSSLSYARHIYQYCTSEYLWSFYMFIWHSYI